MFFDPPQSSADVGQQTLARVLVLQAILAEILSASPESKAAVARRLGKLVFEADGNMQAAAREALSAICGVTLPPIPIADD